MNEIKEEPSGMIEESFIDGIPVQTISNCIRREPCSVIMSVPSETLNIGLSNQTQDFLDCFIVSDDEADLNDAVMNAQENNPSMIDNAINVNNPANDLSKMVSSSQFIECLDDEDIEEDPVIATNTANESNGLQNERNEFQDVSFHTDMCVSSKSLFDVISQKVEDLRKSNDPKMSQEHSKCLDLVSGEVLTILKDATNNNVDPKDLIKKAALGLMGRRNIYAFSLTTVQDHIIELILSVRGMNKHITFPPVANLNLNTPNDRQQNTRLKPDLPKVVNRFEKAREFRLRKSISQLEESLNLEVDHKNMGRSSSMPPPICVNRIFDDNDDLVSTPTDWTAIHSAFKSENTSPEKDPQSVCDVAPNHSDNKSAIQSSIDAGYQAGHVELGKRERNADHYSMQDDNYFATLSSYINHASMLNTPHVNHRCGYGETFNEAPAIMRSCSRESAFHPRHFVRPSSRGRGRFPTAYRNPRFTPFSYPFNSHRTLAQSYNVRATYEEAAYVSDQNSVPRPASSIPPPQKFRQNQVNDAIRVIDVNSLSEKPLASIYTPTPAIEEISCFDIEDGDERTECIEVPQRVTKQRGRPRKTTNVDNTITNAAKRAKTNENDMPNSEPTMTPEGDRRGAISVSSHKECEDSTRVNDIPSSSANNPVENSEAAMNGGAISTTSERYANLKGNFKVKKRAAITMKTPALKSILKPFSLNDRYIQTGTKKKSRVSFNDKKSNYNIPLDSDCSRKATEEKNMPFKPGSKPRYTKESDGSNNEQQGKRATVQLPNSDNMVVAQKREDPTKMKKSDQKKHFSRLENKIDEALHNLSGPDQGHSNSKSHKRNWFIFDSLFENFLMDSLKWSTATQLDYPEMPEWIPEILNDNYPPTSDRLILEFSNIYISIGFDVLVRRYFSRIEELHSLMLKVFEDILSWIKSYFEDKKRSYSTFDNQGGQVNVSYKIPMPRLIIITIPELGTMKEPFGKFNEVLREFVSRYQSEWNGAKPAVCLLDWAKIVKDHGEKRAQESSLEERFATLIDEAHFEFGLLRVHDRCLIQNI